MGLVKILEANGVHPRQDIADALTSSKDMMFPGNHSELYKPQLLHATEWAEANTSGSEDDKVLLMGWASLGKRTLGGPRLGMFIVTQSKFCFIRKADGEDGSEQVYSMDKITNASQSGWLGLRKLSFVASEDGKDHMMERIQKDNAQRIVGYMT